jgi:hypothetical protein
MPRNTTKPPFAIVPTGHGSPPRKLGEAGLNLWNAVQAEYKIDDCGGVELLAQCCAAADRVEALAERIAADGEVIRSRNGLREHPGLRPELAGRSFIVRTLQKLGITSEAIKLPGRPGSGGLGVLGPLEDGDDAS